MVRYYNIKNSLFEKTAITNLFEKDDTIVEVFSNHYSKNLKANTDDKYNSKNKSKAMGP